MREQMQTRLEMLRKELERGQTDYSYHCDQHVERFLALVL